MSERAVRPLTAADIPGVLDLLAAVAAEWRWIAAEPGFDRDARAQGIHDALASPADHAWFVAEGDDGAVVGSIGVHKASYGVAELGMMVDAGHRGLGIGSALLEAAIDWARTAGAHKISLQMWPGNEGARALYEKYGFVDEGLLRDHYRRGNGELWSAVIMGRHLAD